MVVLAKSRLRYVLVLVHEQVYRTQVHLFQLCRGRWRTVRSAYTSQTHWFLGVLGHAQCVSDENSSRSVDYLKCHLCPIRLGKKKAKFHFHLSYTSQSHQNTWDNRAREEKCVFWLIFRVSCLLNPPLQLFKLNNSSDSCWDKPCSTTTISHPALSLHRLFRTIRWAIKTNGISMSPQPVTGFVKKNIPICYQQSCSSAWVTSYFEKPSVRKWCNKELLLLQPVNGGGGDSQHNSPQYVQELIDRKALLALGTELSQWCDIYRQGFII